MVKIVNDRTVMVTYGYQGGTFEVLDRLPVGLLAMQELCMITEIVG